MRLKVMHLTSSPRGIGGVERLLIDTAGKYDASRFEIRYCNLFAGSAAGSALSARLRERGATCHEIPGTRWLDVPGLLARLAALLRTGQYAILHIHMVHATIVGTLAARLARVPIIVVTRHYTDEGYANHGRWLKRFDLRATRAADHVVAVSETTRQYLLTAALCAAGRTTVIPNGLDLEAFDAAHASQDPPWETAWRDGYILGSVGSLTARKGHADLLHALAEVRRIRSDVRLVVVGEGPERPTLERLARDLGVARHVRFVGFRGDIAGLMSHFDVYAHPSREESFGIAILEAMAARKAVASTTAGGIPELVLDGETGLLSPPATPRQFAQHVLRLVDDPALSRRLGERGRVRVERHFTARSVVDRYQQLYGQLTTDESALSKPP